MRDRWNAPLALALALAVGLIPGAGRADAGGPVAPDPGPSKKVLVETFSAPDGPPTPPINYPLALPDRIVSIQFLDAHEVHGAGPHRESAHDHRRRVEAGTSATSRVDGRPIADRSKASAALEAALKEEPGVAIDVSLSGSGRRQVLAVKVAPRPVAAGRDLLIGVALTEVPASPDGPNLARTFDHRIVRPGRPESKPVTIPLELAEGWDASRIRVAVFVQDRVDGRVYQAEALPWGELVAKRELGRLKARRSAALAWVFQWATSMGMTPVASTDAEDGAEAVTTCPNCGTTYALPGVILVPIGSKSGRGGQSTVTVPPVPC